jgi:hypothetical protein
MHGVLAHPETRPRRLPAGQQRAGAELPVGDPKLPRLGALQHRDGQRAFALVRVLARDQVDHQAAVGVVHHDRLPRQSRPTMPSQRCQALVAAGQVIAVKHAQRVARQRRSGGQRCHHRRKPLGRTLHQGAQDARLGVVDLVVERGQRHRQRALLARRRMQRRTQPQRDQRHQLHHRGEQQLTRILALARGLEHQVDPVGGKRTVQRRARHHARRRVLLEPSQDNRPDRAGLC